MKATVFTKAGKKKKDVELNAEIFAAKVNQRLLQIVQKAYAANKRHGKASTKTRKQVRGGGRKPWKQKGTGRARAGSTRSPIWRGGGVVFGPHPRDYQVDLPKAIRKKALISALSLRGGQSNVLLLEDAKLSAPKTKEWAQIVSKLPLDGKRALCVVKEITENLKRATQNLEHRVEIQSANNLNAYHVLQKPKIVIEHDALEIIEQRVLSSRQPVKNATTKKARAPKEETKETKKS